MSRVLIVESRPELAERWMKHLPSPAFEVHIARGQGEAIAQLLQREFEVVVLDLMLEEGSALAVSDFASYRQPQAQMIVVCGTQVFSDGSIFRHCGNARAMVAPTAPPEDLAAMVEHFAVH